jgi:putative ABC transport system substrate-binding protein
LIVVSSIPLAQRAREVTTAVPIVMGVSADPVGSGLAQSFARPGGNVTGLTSEVGPEIQGKRLELLKGAVPGASRVAFLGTKKLWDVVYEKSIKAGAQALGLTVFLAEHRLNTPAPSPSSAANAPMLSLSQAPQRTMRNDV